jgi:cytochrome oxidase assembly protein ShyY1
MRLVGRFDDAKSVFLDNRTRNGTAGFHVLTPLRLEGGAWVMVLRGWVARDARERTRLPVLPEQADAVRVEGFAQASLAQPMVLAAQPDAAPGERLWQHYEADAYRRWSGLPVTEGIVIIRPEAEGARVERVANHGYPVRREGEAREHRRRRATRSLAWGLPGVAGRRDRAVALRGDRRVD